MSKTRKRWLPFIALSMTAIVLALAVPFLTPVLAQSAEPTGLQNVSLSIWPEFDDPLAIGSPAVLVMLEGQITGATAPTTVRFLVPTGAYMYSAGSGPRSQYQGGPPTTGPSTIPGWKEISYTLKTQYFVVEYYVPIGSDPNRSFTSSFIPEYPISGLKVEVQQPKQSTNFVSTPSVVPLNQQVVTNQGYNVTTYRYNALDGQQNLSFAISYARNTLTPSEGSTSTVGGGSGKPNVAVIVILIVVGLAVVGLIGYWVVNPSRGRSATARARAGKGGASSGTKFCGKCGARMEKGARFCPECGAKQKQS